MSAAKVRVAKTEVLLDTVPLTARHWIALGCAVALLAIAWWLLFGRLPVAAPNPGSDVWFAHPGDDRVRADALAGSGGGARAAVIAVGSSVVIENLANDSALTQAIGVPVINLGTTGQSVMESLYILHRGGLRAGQLVLVSVTPNEMAQPADVADARLARGLWLHAPTEFAEAFQRDLPKLAAWVTPSARRAHALAVQRQILYRGVHGGVQRWAAVYLYGDQRPAYTQYRHDHKPPGDLKRQEQLRRYLQGGLAAGFDGHHAENAQVLDVLFRYVRSRGARAVLIDPPRIHGDSLRTYGRYWSPFRKSVRAVADANGVPFVDFNTALQLSADEFNDPVHLSRDGRARWTAAVTEYVSGLCRAQAPSATPTCR